MLINRHCEEAKLTKQSRNSLWIASLTLAITLFSFAVFAADITPADDAGLERRLELAKQMQEIRPAKDQVDKAIDVYVSRLPPNEKESYRAALKNILNYKALEKISIDAYAATYTEEELQAMVSFFGSPEGRSASAKSDEYNKLVFPEIVRMLDKAVMRAKTGASGP
jgi:hypothetical protein